MGIPDFTLNLLASEEARRKRYMIKNEIEEWTDAQTEEVANLPDNSAAILMYLDQKFWHVPKDRYRKEDVNKDDKGEYKFQTEDGTMEEIRRIFSPKVILLVHDKRFVTDTPCCNLAIKYNLIYICVFQLIRDEIKNQTELGAKLLATQKPKSINTFDIENDEFEEQKYSAAHFDSSLVLQLIKKTIMQN